MSLRDYLLCALVGVMLAGGQILFKLVSAHSSNASTTLIETLFSVRLMLALIVYAAATVLWVYVLSSAPLSKAYPVVLLGAALIPIASHYLFGEPIGLRYIIGFSLVLVGIGLVSTS